MTALWSVATAEERRDMAMLILEPGELHYDEEMKEIAAITPRPVFLSVLRLLDRVIEYVEATGTLVTGRWQKRNRRVSNSLSPILYLFLAPSVKLYQKVQHLLAEDETTEGSHPPTVVKHWSPGPKHPPYGIPASQWPTVVQRVVEQKEPLRTIAAAYGVSHETIRRFILHVQKQRGQQDT
jgi:hypothetical protein